MKKVDRPVLTVLHAVFLLVCGGVSGAATLAAIENDNFAGFAVGLIAVAFFGTYLIDLARDVFSKGDEHDHGF